MVNFNTKALNDSIGSIREKIKAGTITDDDLKMSEDAIREREREMSEVEGDFPFTLRESDGLFWMHIPYNDRDVIPRKESLMTHLKAQCPEIPSKHLMNIHASELFSGSIAFEDPEFVAVHPDSADLIIHIGLPQVLYNRLKCHNKLTEIVKSMALCTCYYDADDDLREGMKQGYYPGVTPGHFKKCYFINWNNTFWNELSTTPGVVISAARSGLTQSSSRIAYTTPDANKPGDLFIQSEEYLKVITYTSSGMKSYENPEDAYEYLSPLRAEVCTSYKSDDEKYLMNPDLVRRIMKSRGGQLQGLVDESQDDTTTESSAVSTEGLTDDVDSDTSTTTVETIPTPESKKDNNDTAKPEEPKTDNAGTPESDAPKPEEPKTEANANTPTGNTPKPNNIKKGKK